MAMKQNRLFGNNRRGIVRVQTYDPPDKGVWITVEKLPAGGSVHLLKDELEEIARMAR
jgi:hypothetical protein